MKCIKIFFLWCSVTIYSSQDESLLLQQDATTNIQMKSLNLSPLEWGNKFPGKSFSEIAEILDQHATILIGLTKDGNHYHGIAQEYKNQAQIIRNSCYNERGWVRRD